MANELLYEADKQRLLKELETATITSTRLPALENSEHTEALHDLFGQVVGLPKESQAPPKPKSPRMTNTELKAMKTVSAKVEDPKVSFLQMGSQIMIRFWHATGAMFSFSKPDQTQCRSKGHHCSHCGTTIAFDDKEVRA